jgi:biotin carboxyl carrier protein
MGGNVVRLVAEEGQQVQSGDPLLIIEAMKMERPINAPHAGIVTGLSLEVGDQVVPNAPLCRVVAA